MTDFLMTVITTTLNTVAITFGVFFGLMLCPVTAYMATYTFDAIVLGIELAERPTRCIHCWRARPEVDDSKPVTES